MSDLPTREEINYEDEPDTSARDWPTWLNRMARIAVAYRNRDLMTRAEWEALYPNAVLLIERIDGEHKVTPWSAAVGEETP